ncbi:hypothetical protein [Nonomuraea sp. B19D2]|uniref:hypothetical protein n=1 Tax=Nonomuraea sp. B19D2 TaxID=3159561 RepID=UPI0032DB4AF5
MGRRNRLNGVLTTVRAIAGSRARSGRGVLAGAASRSRRASTSSAPAPRVPARGRFARAARVWEVLASQHSCAEYEPPRRRRWCARAADAGRSWLAYQQAKG